MSNNLEFNLNMQKEEMLEHLDKLNKEESNRKAFIDGITSAFSALFDQLFK